jgi:hypothetical protein
MAKPPMLQRTVTNSACLRTRPPGPFGKLYLSHDLRSQPNVIAHFLGDNALTPMVAFCGRQVGERAFLGG